MLSFVFLVARKSRSFVFRWVRKSRSKYVEFFLEVQNFSKVFIETREILFFFFNFPDKYLWNLNPMIIYFCLLGCY